MNREKEEEIERTVELRFRVISFVFWLAYSANQFDREQWQTWPSFLPLFVLVMQLSIFSSWLFPALPILFSLTHSEHLLYLFLSYNEGAWQEEPHLGICCCCCCCLQLWKTNGERMGGRERERSRRVVMLFMAALHGHFSPSLGRLYSQPARSSFSFSVTQPLYVFGLKYQTF